MRFKTTFLVILLMTIALLGKAQKSDSVTREEMNKYVVMMDSVETLKRLMAETNVKLAKGNEKITAIRYNTLLPLLDDQKKLNEAKATPDEINYLKKAIETRNKNAQNFSAIFTSLMANVGEATYTKVRQAVATDPKAKQRYIDELNKLNSRTSKDQ